MKTLKSIYFIYLDKIISISFTIICTGILVLKFILNTIPIWYLIFVSFSGGFYLGWFLHKSYTKYSEIIEKVKLKDYYGQYKKGNTIKSLHIAMRNLIFYFQKPNSIPKSFALNIKVRGQICIQIIHRAYFPSLCESELDTRFGLAIYIPHDTLDTSGISNLNKTVNEFLTDPIQNTKSSEYTVIDIRTNLFLGNSIISYILKKVFHLTDEADLEYELLEVGNFPYEGLKHII